jgi:hypothetical protein
MQAAEHRFHEDERIRRQTMAGFWLRDDFLGIRRIRHTRSQRAMGDDRRCNVSPNI